LLFEIKKALFPDMHLFFFFQWLHPLLTIYTEIVALFKSSLS